MINFRKKMVGRLIAVSLIVGLALISIVYASTYEQSKGYIYYDKMVEASNLRKPYLNYCIDGTNNSDADYRNLTALFSPIVFNMTFSVVCSSNETMKDAGYSNLETINEFQDRFLADGYNTRVFNPAGQDDIGGGCGQLWYVQQWMKEHN